MLIVIFLRYQALPLVLVGPLMEFQPLSPLNGDALLELGPPSK
jgi:hypothetical protein